MVWLWIRTRSRIRFFLTDHITMSCQSMSSLCSLSRSMVSNSCTIISKFSVHFRGDCKHKTTAQPSHPFRINFYLSLASSTPDTGIAPGLGWSIIQGAKWMIWFQYHSIAMLQWYDVNLLKSADIKIWLSQANEILDLGRAIAKIFFNFLALSIEYCTVCILK